MNERIIHLLLVFAIFCSSFGIVQAADTKTNVSINASSTICTVQIQAEPLEYMNAMSSTVGIGLTPATTLSSVDPNRIQYKWSTNYGFFLNWKSPEFKVKKLGAITTNNGETLYWSYSTPIVFKKNTTPEIIVSVTATDLKTKKVIGKTFLPITRNGTAYKVGNYTCSL